MAARTSAAAAYVDRRFNLNDLHSWSVSLWQASTHRVHFTRNRGVGRAPINHGAAAIRGARGGALGDALLSADVQRCAPATAEKEAGRGVTAQGAAASKAAMPTAPCPARARPLPCSICCLQQCQV